MCRLRDHKVRPTACRLLRPLTVILSAVALLAACTNLDGFLYAPTPAALDADLFASTTIPTRLRQAFDGLVRAEDGVAVSGVALTHDAGVGDRGEPSRFATGILYCHGNNRNLAAFARRIEALWAQGYTVWAFDYRGYGKTAGKPSESGLYADARAVRRYISESAALGSTSERLALYGYSLGAAVATQMAVEARTPALVLEAPFASVKRMLRDNIRLSIPAPWLVDARYDNESKIPQHQGALLVMHGNKDDYLRPSYGARLSALAQGSASPNIFVLVPGADHETVPCQVKKANTVSPGSCQEGFDPAYLQAVTTLIDGAIAPLP